MLLALSEGRQDRIDAFTAEHPSAEVLPCRQRRVLLAGVDPTRDHAVFGTETFAPIYATTVLPGDTPEECLGNAVAFSNDRLAGNLSANLIIDPATAKRLGPRRVRQSAFDRDFTIATRRRLPPDSVAALEWLVTAAARWPSCGPTPGQ